MKKTPYVGNIPSWTNEEERQSIWVERSGGGYDVRTDVLMDGNVTEHFETKKLALSFANKYMKEHDSC